MIAAFSLSLYFISDTAQLRIIGRIAFLDAETDARFQFTERPIGDSVHQLVLFHLRLSSYRADD
jgi:hypothetical protein